MKTNFTKSLFFFAFLLFSLQQVFAQKIEAESAIISGGGPDNVAVIQPSNTASGGYYVDSKESNLSFSVNIPETSFYNIYIYAAAPNGDKINTISIDGSGSDFSLTTNTDYLNLKAVSSYKLTAGQHTIEIIKSWGWINIDYITLEKVDASDRFDINQTLVTPNPTPEAVALYRFLLDNYGQKIISGVMTLNSFDESNWLKTNTGKEPALLGIDLMHTNRGYNWYDDQTPINDALAWYNKNGIPALMWHWRDPSRTTEAFYTDETNFDVSKIFDPNSSEYKAMIADIDYTSSLLKKLQDNHVAVIWRPLHEAAGGWFWWGAKGGAACKELYQVMYDRMVNVNGLRNLIWVWTREPNDEDWYPGDAYVDIVGRDVYKDGDHGSQAIEFNNMNALYGGKKMIALTECGSFPDVDNLINDGTAWSWYMPWYGKYTENSTYNSLDLWKKMFASDYVITLDEMPDLRSYGTITGIAAFNSEKTLVAYPSPVVNTVNIKSKDPIQSIIVYNTLGERVVEKNTHSRDLTLGMAGLKAGIYYLKVNGSETIKIVKE